MPSYAEQIAAAQKAHTAVNALEVSTRQQVEQAFFDWESGKLNAQTIRHKLEAIVRAGYRSAAAIGQANTVAMADLPGWKPQASVFTSDYLTALLKDVRANLRAYKASDKDDIARRRATLRETLSAGVGVQRGYTDALVQSNKELADFGYQIKKVWLTTSAAPCPYCAALHGKEVGLDEDFDSSSKLKVYQNLQGPPRHPNCQCILITIITTLENAFEKLDIDDQPPEPKTMRSEDVASMPAAIFAAVVKALQKIMKLMKGK